MSFLIQVFLWTRRSPLICPLKTTRQGGFMSHHFWVFSWHLRFVWGGHNFVFGLIFLYERMSRIWYYSQFCICRKIVSTESSIKLRHIYCFLRVLCLLFKFRFYLDFSGAYVRYFSLKHGLACIVVSVCVAINTHVFIYYLCFCHSNRFAIFPINP